MDTLQSLGGLFVFGLVFVFVVLCILLPISAYSAQKYAYLCYLELQKLNAARSAGTSAPMRRLLLAVLVAGCSTSQDQAYTAAVTRARAQAESTIVATPVERIGSLSNVQVRDLLANGDSLKHPEWMRAAAANLTERQRAATRGLGVTREAIAAAFPSVQFSVRTLNSGEESFSGQGAGADVVTLVEIIGPAHGPTKASVISGIARDAPSTAATAIANAGRLIKATAGDDKACLTWYVAAIGDLETTPKPTAKCGANVIELSRAKSLGLITITIRAP